MKIEGGAVSLPRPATSGEPARTEHIPRGEGASRPGGAVAAASSDALGEDVYPSLRASLRVARPRRELTDRELASLGSSRRARAPRPLRAELDGRPVAEEAPSLSRARPLTDDDLMRLGNSSVRRARLPRAEGEERASSLRVGRAAWRSEAARGASPLEGNGVDGSAAAPRNPRAPSALLGFVSVEAPVALSLGAGLPASATPNPRAPAAALAGGTSARAPEAPSQVGPPSLASLGLAEPRSGDVRLEIGAPTPNVAGARPGAAPLEGSISRRIAAGQTREAQVRRVGARLDGRLRRFFLDLPKELLAIIRRAPDSLVIGILINVAGSAILFATYGFSPAAGPTLIFLAVGTFVGVCYADWKARFTRVVQEVTRGAAASTRTMAESVRSMVSRSVRVAQQRELEVLAAESLRHARRGTPSAVVDIETGSGTRGPDALPATPSRGVSSQSRD